MEIDVTAFFTEVDPMLFSASAAELGADAGRITWANAKDEAAKAPLLATDKALEALRAWAKDTGAWDAEERAAWSADDCNALFIQMISGDMRVLEALCSNDDGEIDWTKAEALAEEGTIQGALFRSADRIYYYLGS